VSLRVLFHAHVCPDCESDDITESEVETGDGITEIALTCHACGAAWPVACVVDWSTQP
jgi:translation initiation factor 2 beta subunit (eIF-2beta)/eIF-5